LLLTFRYYTHKTRRGNLKCQPAPANAQVSCAATSSALLVGGVGRQAVGEVRSQWNVHAAIFISPCVCACV